MGQQRALLKISELEKKFTEYKQVASREFKKLQRQIDELKGKEPISEFERELELNPEAEKAEPETTVDFNLNPQTESGAQTGESTNDIS